MAEQSLYRLLGFHGSCTVQLRSGTIGVSSLVERAFTGSIWMRISVSKAFYTVINRVKAPYHSKNGCTAGEEEVPQAKKRLTNDGDEKDSRLIVKPLGCQWRPCDFSRT